MPIDFQPIQNKSKIDFQPIDFQPETGSTVQPEQPINRATASEMDVLKDEFLPLIKAGQWIIGSAEKGAQTLERRHGLMAKAVNEGMDKLTSDEQKEIIDYVTGFATMGMNTVAKTGLSQTASKIAPKGKAGIRTTIAEDIGSRLGKFVDTASEKIPFSGMGRFRKLQQLEADDAAKQFLSKYIADPVAPDIAKGNADYINNLYETMKQTAKTGNVKVAATTTQKSTGELLNRYPSVFESIQDTKTKNILKNIMGDTKAVKEKIKAVDYLGSPIEVEAKINPTFDFDTLWELRKGLGQAITDARTDTAKRVLANVKYAVSDDMERLFASTNTEASQMFKSANEAYKNFEVKYKQVQEAYDYASGVKGAGEQGFFSPQKFGTKLKNLAYKEKGKGGYSAWTPQEIEEATGLANVMQVVKRAGQYMENPPTGNRLSDLWILGLAIKTPLIPISWVTTFLNTTKQGKSLLKTAASVDPTSTAMKTVMLTIYGKYREQNPNANQVITLDTQGNEITPEPKPKGKLMLKNPQKGNIDWMHY